MSGTPSTGICPNVNCKKSVTISENGMVCVHFTKVEDVKPCSASYSYPSKEKKK